MKLIKPSYTILNENDLFSAAKAIEVAARTCYKSEDKISDTSEVALIVKLISMGHEAMLEFGPSISVLFVCDRGVSHELVRHRLCSFAQESTRYCNYSKDKFDNQVTFIIPPWVNNVSNGATYQQGYGFTHEDNSVMLWGNFLLDTEATYMRLLELGWQPQQARAVLPNSLKTEIVVKSNIREWRHIFKQRTSSKAHPQMRELMIPLLEHFKKFCPLLFNDIEIK